MRELTEKQGLVLDFINSYQLEHGYPPTYRDIAKKFLISVKGAYDHVQAMNQKGIDTKLKKALKQVDKIKNDKNKVRGQTALLIKNGLLTPAPCMVCGGQEVESHHETYSRPDSILWLCSEHHRQWHQLLKITDATIKTFKDYYLGAIK